MTDDEFKPLDLNAFLQNSQLLQPAFKENYSHYLKQLLQKAVDAWDNDPQLAYKYCEEFKQNIPASVLPEIFRLIDKPESEDNIRDYLDIEKRTELRFEKISIHAIKACFFYRHLDIDECASECKIVLSIDNNHKHSNFLLALCLAIRGKHSDAIPFYKKVIRSEYYRDSATANLAYSYLFLRKNIKAYRLFAQIVDKFTDNYRVQYYMALCCSRFWLNKKSVYYLDRAESLEKNFSGIYLTRGSIFYKAQKWDKAYKDLYRAKQLGSVKADQLLKTL